jgi:hypothetical protein
MKRILCSLALAMTATSLSMTSKAQNSMTQPQDSMSQPQDSMSQPQAPKANPQDSMAQPRSEPVTAEKQSEIDELIKTWPANSKTAAKSLVEKYGMPDGMTVRSLSWNDRDPWSRVEVLREGITDNFPTTHQNFIENTVRYGVPRDKAGELIKFDSALIVDQKAGTVAVRSNSEKSNILALNLADEIVTGKRTVDEARTFMRDTLRADMAGKSSPYTDHLLFSVDKVPAP